MDLIQFTSSSATMTKFELKQVLISANFAHFKVAIQDIEFVSFENSFVLSCDSGSRT